MMKPLRLTRWQMAKMLAAQINRDYPISAKLAILSIVVLFLCVISVLTRPKTLENLLGLPVLRGSKSRKNDLLSIIKEGKQKVKTERPKTSRRPFWNLTLSAFFVTQYPDTPYIVDATELQYVVYPPALFDEIKRLTEKEASVQDFFRTISYGYIGTETDALCKTIAVDLARSIPLKIPSQQKDARIAFDKYVGYCLDYKPIVLFDAMMEIFGSVNASSFVGREIGTGEWPRVVQQLLMSVYFAVRTLSWIPRVLKPIVWPLVFLPALKVQRDMRRILSPVIRRDMEEYERAADRKEVLKPTDDGKLPFTQWLMARYKPSEATRYQLTTDHLLVNVEATIKSATALYSIVLELATRPELQDELRHEVEEVIMVDGRLPSTHLKELRKLDSMMRETSRVNPFALCEFLLFGLEHQAPPHFLQLIAYFLVTLCRKTRRPLQLSSGPMLPAGTILCVDSHRINNSATLFPEPENFHPNRFLSKRAKPGAEHRFQFVSTGPTDPNWGDGTQACPGRFFANSTLKVCLAHLLMNYNVKLGEGQEQPNMVGMPNGILAPDMAVQVFFQSRN